MGRVFAWHVKVLDSVANNTDENNKDYLFPPIQPVCTMKVIVLALWVFYFYNAHNNFVV